MAEILKYVTVDRNGVEGDYEFDTLKEAREVAGTNSAVMQRTYLYDDSELVYTPDGGDQWPPAESEEDAQ